MKAKCTFNSAYLRALLKKETLATSCFVNLEAHHTLFLGFPPPYFLQF